MERSDIERLAKVRAFPAVSVLLPLQHQRPGNPEDPLRLRHLRNLATERLLREHDRREVQPLIERLHREISQVDLDHPAPGLAIFATVDEAEHHLLPFAVRERVVVNETFATRDLLVGLARAERYRVLVLSLRRSLLYDASGGLLRPISRHGFPVEVTLPVEEDTPHRDLPIHEQQRAEAFRYAFRAVDRALGDVAAVEALPVVVVGPARDLSFFDEVTTHRGLIAGRVTGHHTDTAPAALVGVVEQVADAHFARRRDEALRTLVDAVGAKRAALGVDEVWEAAQQGRGHLLVVEEDFTFPARVVDDHLEAPGEAAEASPGLHDDAVDEAVDAVLAHGGSVVVVESGRLAEHDRIGLVLRY